MNIVDEEVSSELGESMCLKRIHSGWHYVQSSQTNIRQFFSEQIDLTDFSDVKVNLEERDLKLRRIGQSFLDTSPMEDPDDVRIETLQDEIELVQSELKNLIINSSTRVDDQRLLTRTDLLRASIRELNYKIECLERDYNQVKNEHETFVDSIIQFQVENAFQNEIDQMRDELTLKTLDYEESQTLLKELFQMGWSKLPPNNAECCANIFEQMENLKNRLETARLNSFKLKIVISKTIKEILALKSSYESELQLQVLYKAEIQKVQEIKRKLDLTLKTYIKVDNKNIRKLKDNMPKLDSVLKKDRQISKLSAETPSDMFNLSSALGKSSQISKLSAETTEDRNIIPQSAEMLKLQGIKKKSDLVLKAYNEVINRGNWKLGENEMSLASALGIARQINTSKVSVETTESRNKIQRSIVNKEDKIEFLSERYQELQKEIAAVTKQIEEYKKETNDKLPQPKEIESKKMEVANIRKIKAENMELLQQEINLRKAYYNQIENLKGKIRVFCRCRPISKEEMSKGYKSCISIPDSFTIVVTNPKDKNSKEFVFDQIFLPKSTQEEIFNNTSTLFQSTFDGYNVCIFAYGQTGSGKTYTLIGNLDEDPGIVPRAFEKLFNVIELEKLKFRTKVQCYMLELYNEKLLDLLATDSVHTDKLEIKKDPHGMVFIPGAEISGAANANELKDLFLKGNNHRHIASTKMNSESSRSHLIISMLLTCFLKNSEKIVRGKISIIDLAGSERVSKSGVQGVGVQEAMSINVSLTSLGDVISALTTGQAFIPYRNNKLTMLMQDSIGGNAKTLMFVNISPVDYNVVETVSSLTYGSRVKLIKNEATKVADVDEISKLQKIIESLLRHENVTF